MSFGLPRAILHDMEVNSDDPKKRKGEDRCTGLCSLQPGFSELIPTEDCNESMLVTASVGSYLVCNCHSVQLNIIQPPWDLKGGI